MTRVTGTGCGLSAVVGAFCAVDPFDAAKATAAAFGFYGLCGDVAVKISDKPASFATVFIDQLFAVGDNEIAHSLRVGESVGLSGLEDPKR